MAVVNEMKREINAKIVYFGPVASGKTTSLNYIYRKLKTEYRSQIKTMTRQKDRLLFFDFMPPAQGGAGGYNVRFHIYTMAGESLTQASWKTLLKGVDGIVFVADSTPGQQSANRESLAVLQQHLADYGTVLRDVSCIVQCNKQDMPAAVPPEEINALFDGERLPVLASSASKGEGVLEGLYHVVKMILKRLREEGLATKNPQDIVQPPTAPQSRMNSQFKPVQGTAEEIVLQEFAFTTPEEPAEIDRLVPASQTEAAALPDGDITIRLDDRPITLDGNLVGIPLAI